jgi:hypothetical protein
MNFNKLLISTCMALMMSSVAMAQNTQPTPSKPAAKALVKSKTPRPTQEQIARDQSSKSFGSGPQSFTSKK